MIGDVNDAYQGFICHHFPHRVCQAIVIATEEENYTD